MKLNAATHAFILENDLFVGTDRHYTNGTFYSVLEDDISVPWIIDISSMNKKNKVLTLSQLMFTPEKLEDSQKILDDSPYAGHIALTWSLYQSNSNFLHNMAFSIGAVGPISLSEQTQKAIHKARGITIPQGWDHQLDNKATAGLVYQFAAKTKAFELMGLDVDWTTNIRFDYGNFYSGTVLGSVIRFGNYFAKNFPTTGGFVGGHESSMLDMKKLNSLSWAISIGGYGNSVDNFYVVDEGIRRGYDLKKINHITGGFVSLNIYYKKLEMEIQYKSAVVNDIELNPDTIMGNHGALGFRWKWD